MGQITPGVATTGTGTGSPGTTTSNTVGAAATQRITGAMWSLTLASASTGLFGSDNPLNLIDTVTITRNVTNLTNRPVGSGSPYEQPTGVTYDAVFTGGMTGPAFAYLMVAVDAYIQRGQPPPRLTATAIVGNQGDALIQPFTLTLDGGNLGTGSINIGQGDAATSNSVTVRFQTMTRA